jgi:hypothetical protein
MTYEEMARSVENVVQQLGRIEASMERYNESILQQQAKFASEMMQIKELGKDLAMNQLRMQNAIAALAASHKELDRRLAESHESLTESQKKMDERMRSFLSALERRFGGNGHG